MSRTTVLFVLTALVVAVRGAFNAHRMTYTDLDLTPWPRPAHTSNGTQNLVITVSISLYHSTFGEVGGCSTANAATAIMLNRPIFMMWTDINNNTESCRFHLFLLATAHTRTCRVASRFQRM